MYHRIKSYLEKPNAGVQTGLTSEVLWSERKKITGEGENLRQEQNS